MRKLMSLVLVISGLALGCGSDGNGDDNNATANGNGNGGSNGDSNGDSSGGIDIPDDMSGGGEKYPDCKVREDIPAMFPAYTGMKTMTASQFMACQTKCGMDENCYNETNCPGFEMFNTCLNTEVLGCAASEGGKCRTEYEDVECCAEANKCAANDENCVTMKCDAEIGAFGMCGTGDRACLQKGFQACVAPEGATGTTMMSTTSNMTTTINTTAVLQMLRAVR